MAVPASSLPGSLPIPRTRLIGREAARASARAFLLDGAVPLLTLTGPGGVGKTRLALAIAQDVASAFADGVVWVDLAPLSDPALVPAALAKSLDIAASPHQPVAEALVRQLRSRQTLLLLDNCEHLIAGVVEVVAHILDTSPALQILATSRAPLRVRGEQEFSIDPLPLPAPSAALSLESLAQNEAVRLFTERSHAVRPEFALTEKNAPSVVAICQRVDGLPLAIELAAARSKILSPAALLAQMTERLRLLSGGQRDLPARQRTIEATIDWSYNLLDLEGQRLFRHLAVFSGGCDLETIVAVSGGDRLEVVRGIEALCEQSLLRTTEGSGGNDRYVMLETVHEYALVRLDESGEAEAALEAHADYFLDLAETAEPRLETTDETIWAHLQTDYPNLLAALRWLREQGDAERVWRLAGALHHFWLLQNDFSEGKCRLEEALALPSPTRTAAWAKAQTALGDFTNQRGDTAGARALLDGALAVWQELGHQRGIATALSCMASVDYVEGHLDRARIHFAEALATFRSLGDVGNTALMLQSLGAVSIVSGDYPRARANLEEASRLEAGLGLLIRGAVTGKLAWLSYVEGDEQRAADLWEERLTSYREQNQELLIAITQEKLGWLALRQGGYQRAASCFAEELTLGAKLGETYEWARGLMGLALVNAEIGHAARAAWLLGAVETAAGDEDLFNQDMLFPMRDEYERAVAATQGALGEAEFAAAWRTGRGLPPRRAAAMALIDAEALGALPAESFRTQTALPERLTPREAEVLRLLVKRWTDREIADALHISPRTVHHHVARVFGKLGVENRREAGAVAARLGLA